MNGPSAPPSNGSLSCEPEPQHISITVFLCLLFLGGFLLNSFSLWVFCLRMPRWGPGTTLQFHLALSDAIVTPTAPLMAAYLALGSHWPFGRFLCQLKIALLSTHFYGSILFLTLISVHRYVSVVQYSKASPMKRVGFIHKLCAAVWLLLLLKGAACFSLLGTSQVGNHTQCLSIHQGEYIQVYFSINFSLLVPAFLVPFSVSVACYCRLASSVSRINASTANGRAIKAKSRKMVAVCLLIFAVCFMPLNIVRSVGVVVRKYYPEQCRLLLRVETAYYVSWILASANSCFDPLLYCFGSQDFTRAFRRSLRKIGLRFEDGPSRNGLDSVDSVGLTTKTTQSSTVLDRETASTSSL
ncbi:P2Y purinoceptor 2 [Megalops cyprinoides]|uniref:P2Y purinoceptor 2 n=1 Tax=Megalops cyprinoides TaxID=118141 RepID=UPI00186556F4|nr:P2Y purinoceptor 2 [Megalops cyprinoides]